MTDAELVRVEGVSKRFCRNFKRSLWYGFRDTGADLLGSTNADRPLRRDEFWAVNDVSFSVKRGECLGLIGRNGAGKTTLLKMLNGLVKPDKGRIEMRGRVGALIALGAGFNPVLTGRENVYVNAAILGLSRREVARRFDEIVDFADIGEFIDTPVQSYSSGMQVRLGFAVAAHINPDVLLVDEVLSVGDAGFKIKCYNKMFELRDQVAIIFVSHSMPQMAKVCTSGILMRRGQVEIDKAPISDVIQGYLQAFDGAALTRVGNGGVVIERLGFRQGDGPSQRIYPAAGERPLIEKVDPVVETTLELEGTLTRDCDSMVVQWTVLDVEQKPVTSAWSDVVPGGKAGGNISVRLRIPALSLNSGRYTFSMHLYESETGEFDTVLAGVRDVASISVWRGQHRGAAPVVYNVVTEVGAADVVEIDPRHARVAGRLQFS